MDGVLERFPRLPSDIRGIIMSYIPATFRILSKGYREKVKQMYHDKTVYLLTHHPTRFRIIKTIKQMIKESERVIQFSFLDVSESLFYIFFIYKKNDVHKVERYTKSPRTDDLTYSKVLLYRDRNYATFVSKLHSFFSLFVTTLHDQILYDQHILSKILYSRKKHPLCAEMNVDNELFAYYEPYITKEFSYPKYRDTTAVTKISLISFLSDRAMNWTGDSEETTIIKWT